MSAWILLIAVYAVAAINIAIIKKIQPNNKKCFLNIAWTVFVCMVITIFLFAYGSMAKCR